MTDLKPTLLSVLANLPACTRAAFALEEPEMPILVVGDYGGRVIAQADGCAYQEEYVVAVDVYAADQETLESLCRQADAALEAAGLRRVYQTDFYDETAYAWRKGLRYRAVLQGGKLYQ